MDWSDPYKANDRSLLIVPSKARHYLYNEEPALVVEADRLRRAECAEEGEGL